MIEIKGVNTVNKGAHLMLLSILSEFKKRGREEKFCIKPSAGMNYFSAAKHDLFLKVDFKGKKLPWNKILSLLPKQIRRNHGFVLDKEVDVILDASGFAYGDFWGHQKIDRNLNNFLQKKARAKLVLLPQALGPFKDAKVKDTFEKVVNRADLIFARDAVSYKNLVEVYGERSNFRKAPDFTNLLFSGEKNEYPEGEVCIIPNYKMTPTEKKREQYYLFLVRAIEAIKNQKRKPYFLIHEGKKDKRIALDINEQLALPLEIVYDENPLQIKNRISSAELIIVSRFHGLVSALSQGIPAITTSWNHKYEELVKDYQLEECLLNVESYDAKDLEGLILRLLNKSVNDHRIQQQNHIERQKKKTTKMWNEIFEVISQPD